MAARPGTEFFADTCHEVLDPWFSERGFHPLDAYCTSTMAAWRRGGFFIRVSFWPTDAPNFSLMAGLGEVRDGWGLFGPRKPLLRGCGLWEVIEDEDDRAILRRPFHDRAELADLLADVRERALHHGERSIEDPATLRRVIRRRR